MGTGVAQKRIDTRYFSVKAADCSVAEATLTILQTFANRPAPQGRVPFLLMSVAFPDIRPAVHASMTSGRLSVSALTLKQHTLFSPTLSLERR